MGYTAETPSADGSMAKTYSRDRFTRALTAICEALDQTSEAQFEIATRIFGMPLEGEVQARVLRLWAFGSWSRGAVQCGDLDLAIEFSARWSKAPTGFGRNYPVLAHLVLPKLIPRKSLVHLVEFSEIAAGRTTIDPDSLVPIWNRRAALRQSASWKRAIGRIKPDESAGRFARPADEFPISPIRSGFSAHQTLELLRLREERILDWQFIAHGETRGEIDVAAVLSPEEERELSEHPRFEPVLVNRALVATRVFREERSQRIGYAFGNESAARFAWLTDEKVDILVLTPTWKAHESNGSLALFRGLKWSKENAEYAQERLRAERDAAQAKWSQILGELFTGS